MNMNDLDVRDVTQMLDLAKSSILKLLECVVNSNHQYLHSLANQSGAVASAQGSNSAASASAQNEKQRALMLLDLQAQTVQNLFAFWERFNELMRHQQFYELTPFKTEDLARAFAVDGNPGSTKLADLCQFITTNRQILAPYAGTLQKQLRLLIETNSILLELQQIRVVLKSAETLVSWAKAEIKVGRQPSEGILKLTTAPLLRLINGSMIIQVRNITEQDVETFLQDTTRIIIEVAKIAGGRSFIDPPVLVDVRDEPPAG